MGLMQLNELGLNKIEMAIEIIKQNAIEPYYVANSFGKDSGICVDLVKRADVDADFHYNVSPIDPPEVYKFGRQYHLETVWEHLCKNFWQLVDKKGLPSRKSRWCCEHIKEGGGSGRIVITGVRWAEGTSRKSRCMIEPDRKDKTKRYLHPIICWTDAEVWEYYQITKIPYLSLYNNGWKRVGCVGCPMAGAKTQRRELLAYPKIANLWHIHATNYFNSHPDSKIAELKTPERFWDWWLSGKSVKKYLHREQSSF